MLSLDDYISPLDTERFGFKIAKVDFNNSDEVGEIVSFLNQQEVVLIITKVSCENIDLINQLEKAAFKTMDFQVSYDYYGTKENQIQINKSGFPVREIRSVDIPQLIQIAESSFDGFGHYSADKRLDRKTCVEIYKDWTRNVCTRKEFADIVFAAYDAEKPIGFFAFKTKQLNNEPMATGKIGAVSYEYAGKGIFQSLIRRGMEWAASKNLILRDVKVHATNYSINAAFAKMGFRIRNAQITMHYWNENSRA